MSPRLLDLYCGAGGAARGYADAGFEVVGIDNRPQPRYPFEFIQADALNPPVRLEDFDVIHASPPCQRWMGVPRARCDAYPDLLTPTRAMLRDTDVPWVIENLPTAPLNGPVLCGGTFGLPLVRHRRFETSWPLGLLPSTCHQSSWARGTAHFGAYPYAHGAWRPAWREYVMPAVWPWMTIEETAEAIPPEFSRFIGEQLMALLGERTQT